MRDTPAACSRDAVREVLSEYPHPGRRKLAANPRAIRRRNAGVGLDKLPMDLSIAEKAGPVVPEIPWILERLATF